MSSVARQFLDRAIAAGLITKEQATELGKLRHARKDADGVAPGMEEIAVEAGYLTADQARRVPGIPVYEEQSITVMGSAITSRTTTLEIREAKAPSAAFRLPRGYARETYDPLEGFRR